MKLNLSSVELSDEDVEEYKEGEEKVPICKRCWIFKRNKDFVQGKVLSARPAEKTPVGVDRYAEHKKFLSRLKEYQLSQPYETTIKSATVTQVVSDSVEEIKNLFVNNTVVYNSKINLKALASSMEKKKEFSSPIGQNSIFGGTRSLRLSRKCKQKNQQIFEFEDNDDLLFEGDPDTHIQYTGKTKRDKVKHPMNGENGKASQSIPKVIVEEKVLLSPDKIFKHADVLFEHAEASSAVSSKKRKIDVKMKDDDDFICVNTSRNSKAHEPLPKSDNARVKNKRRINGEDEAKQPPNNVIEIDGEITEEEEASNNKADTNITPKINCPMCNKLFPVEEINDHAYTCQGPQTQTRSQQVNNGSRATYNATAWNNACRGLNPDNSETSGKINEPVEKLEHGGKSENKFENKGREKLKQNNFKDPLKEVKLPSKLENKNIHCESAKNRLFAAKTSGYQNLNLDKNLDKSTQELLEGYAKTIHKVRNPSKAKQMRSFGEQDSDEQEHCTRCARCDQFVADDQLKNHTDQCFDKSVLIE